MISPSSCWLHCNDEILSPVKHANPKRRKRCIIVHKAHTRTVLNPSCTEHSDKVSSTAEIVQRIRELPKVAPPTDSDVAQQTASIKDNFFLNMLPTDSDRICAVIACNMPPDVHEIVCDVCTETYIDSKTFDAWLDRLFHFNRPYHSDPSRIVEDEAPTDSVCAPLPDHSRKLKHSQYEELAAR